MDISAASIKQLRELTGAGVLDCRKALEANGGDFEKAAAFLRQKGLAAAATLREADREAKNGAVEVYAHGGGRVGVMVEVNCETDFVARTEQFRAFAHDVALHIAAANPRWVDVADVPPDMVAAQTEAYRESALAEGKPAGVVDKIVVGRLEAFYAEHCLLRQPFVKDETTTVGDRLKETVAAIGENVIVRRFARFELGAGV